MTGSAEGPQQPDEPLRWPRDSAEEDAEAHRAAELDRLGGWAREQRLRPLTDTLEAHGITRDHRESWGRYIVPSWWAETEPPAAACPWCQAPGPPVTCGPCAAAQAASPGPGSLTGWWESLTPLGRRLHLSARWGTDPWTGRAVRIEFETTAIDEEAGLGVSRARLHSPAPPTSWDTRRES